MIKIEVNFLEFMKTFIHLASILSGIDKKIARFKVIYQNFATFECILTRKL